MSELVSLVVGIAIGALGLLAIDFLFYRKIFTNLFSDSHRLKDQLTASSAEIAKLKSELNKQTEIAAKSLAAQSTQPVAPVPVVDSFANSMPNPVPVVEGSPEFAALKTRIGEVIANNVLLETKVKDRETLVAKIDELKAQNQQLAAQNEVLVQFRNVAAEKHQQLQSAFGELGRVRDELRQVMVDRDESKSKLSLIEAYAQSLIQKSTVSSPAPEPNNLAYVNSTQTRPDPTPTASSAVVVAPLSAQAMGESPVEVVPEHSVTPSVAQPKASPAFEVRTAIVTERPAPRPTTPAHDLMALPGMNADMVARFYGSGITSARQLAMMSPSQVGEIAGEQARLRGLPEEWVRHAARHAFGVN